MRPLKLAVLAIPSLLAPGCFWERQPSTSTTPSCVEQFYVSAADVSGTPSQFGHYLALNDQFVAVSGLTMNMGSPSARIYVLEMNAPKPGFFEISSNLNGRNGFDISNDTVTYFQTENNINLEIKATQISDSKTASYGRSNSATYLTTYGQSIISRHGQVFISNYCDMPGTPILKIGATQVEPLFGNINFPGAWGRPLLGSSRWLVMGGVAESKLNDFRFALIANANVITNWKLVNESLSDDGCTIWGAHDPGEATGAALAQPNAALAGDILVAQVSCGIGNQIAIFSLAEGGAQRLKSESINSIPDLKSSSLWTLARDSEHETDLTAVGVVHKNDTPGTAWVTRVSAEAPGLAAPTGLIPTSGSPSASYGSGLAVSGTLVAVGDPTPTGGTVHIFKCQ